MFFFYSFITGNDETHTECIDVISIQHRVTVVLWERKPDLWLDSIDCTDELDEIASLFGKHNRNVQCVHFSMSFVWSLKPLWLVYGVSIRLDATMKYSTDIFFRWLSPCWTVDDKNARKKKKINQYLSNYIQEP